MACSEHHPFLGHPGTSRSMSRISRMAGSAYKQHHTKCNMLSADYQELCLADSITHDGAHHAIFILVLISHLSSCQYAWTSNLERDVYSEQTMYSRQRQLCLSGSAFLHWSDSHMCECLGMNKTQTTTISQQNAAQRQRVPFGFARHRTQVSVLKEH